MERRNHERASAHQLFLSQAEPETQWIWKSTLALKALESRHRGNIDRVDLIGNKHPLVPLKRKRFLYEHFRLDARGLTARGGLGQAGEMPKI